MKHILRGLCTPVIIGLMMMVSFASPASAHSINSQNLLPKSPYSTSVLVAQGLRNGTIHLSGHGSGIRATPNLNCNPAPCVFIDKRVSPGAQPVNETPIAVDPLNNNHLLTGGNDYNCANVQGFYKSINGGGNFVATCMATFMGGFGEGDPGVGYDRLNHSYITGIEGGTPDGSDIIFEKSLGGGPFGAPAAAVKPFFPGGLTDKDWLQIDDTVGSPHVNCLYISVTQFATNNNSTITVSDSCNGGATWTEVQVDTTQTYPAIDQFSDLAIDKNGNVYVSWMRCTANGPAGDCGGTTATLVEAMSPGGALPFGAVHTIASVKLTPDSCNCAFYGNIPGTNERVSNIPSIDVDRSNGVHSGNVYAAFYNWTGAQMQVEVATLPFPAIVWNAPVRVSAAAGDEFFPWLTVSKTEIVGVTWNDRRNGAGLSYEEFGALSNNGGAGFGVNYQLASALSNPNNDGFGGSFIGDYTGNIWAGKKLYAVWTDTRNNIDQEWMGGIKNNA